MTEEQVKQQLAEMLDSFTAGSVLHLLADLYQEAADEASEAGDTKDHEQANLVRSTLIVVGMGIDAANPR